MKESSPGLAGLSPAKRALLEARLLKAPGGNATKVSRRDPGKPCHLSFAQEQLWILDRVRSGTPTYNIAEVLRLQGRLDLAILESSLCQLVARHEALRTTFAEVADGPVQVIHPAARPPLPVVDLGGMPETMRLNEACLRANQEARRPFDLGTGPLIRFQAMRLSDEEWFLGIYMHHIVADAWSVGVMTREISELYQSQFERRPAGLSELPIQFADFAQWQREWVEGPSCQPQFDYWKQRLAGAPELLTLPTDRPRPATLSSAGRYEASIVPRSMLEGLQSLGRRAGATLFITLLAAFDVLLYLCTGQEDIIVGTPVAGRNMVELEGLLGFFVNMLVLRIDLAGNPPFAQVLQRAREAATAAFAHPDIPFEKLVAVLQPTRTPSHNPIFQVGLILQNASDDEFVLPGLKISRVSVATETSKFDLTLFATEKPDGLHLGIEYSTDLFDAATIRRMLGHLQQLMQSILADPNTPIAQLNILTEAERRQLLHDWNLSARPYPTGDCVHQLFEAQVRRTPDAPAVIDGARRFTYRELDRHANRVAAHLRAAGVQPEVLVAVCLERSAEMVVALLGVLKAGGAYVPVDPEYPADRVAFMLDDAQAAVLLTQRSLQASLPASRAPVITIEDLMCEEGLDGPPGGQPQPNHLAYVIYTSGSTGQPKGAMNEHRGVVNRLLWMQEQYRLTGDDVVLQKTPFSFDVSVWEFFWPLMAGARLVMAKSGGHKDPAYLIRLINDCGVTTIHFVPPMLSSFLAEKEAETCRSLRRVICSGEALPFDLQESFFRKMSSELHNLYGPTEAAVDVTHWTCPRESSLPIVPIGRPVANTQLYILNSQGQPVPIGVPGELHLGGVQVGRGYWRRPDLTAQKFVADPFGGGGRLYRTGDLCRYRPDGNVEYLGRLDQQVKIRGFRIELGEIESVLVGHPSVREAAVLVREAGTGDRHLVAYLVVTEEKPAIRELREYLRTKIPDYMVPAAFVYLEALPLSPNGKVDRRRLPEPSRDVAGETRSIVAPRNETEAMLVEIWRDVLKRDRIGVNDNFFELGGHSLLVIRVASRIREKFGLELLLADVFNSPTLADLAIRLSNRQIEACDPEELARLLDEIESEAKDP